jgi:hypothetical protein
MEDDQKAVVYGKANEHNGQIPSDCWLEDWEKQAILDSSSKGGLP